MDSFILDPEYGTQEATLYLACVPDTVFLQALWDLPHCKCLEPSGSRLTSIIDLRLNQMFNLEEVRAAIEPLANALNKRQQGVVETETKPEPYTLGHKLMTWGGSHEGMYFLYLQLDPDDQLLQDLKSDPAVWEARRYDEERKIFLQRRLAFEYSEFEERIKFYVDRFHIRYARGELSS